MNGRSVASEPKPLHELEAYRPSYTTLQRLVAVDEDVRGLDVALEEDEGLLRTGFLLLIDRPLPTKYRNNPQRLRDLGWQLPEDIRWRF